MRIKRYEAPSIQEALLKVKKDLGPEAVILYTKTFRKGGVLGFFGKPVAEITAGIDLNLMEDVGKRVATTSLPFSSPVPENGVSAMFNAPAAPLAVISSPLGTMDPSRPKTKALQRELNEMKTSTFAHVLRDLSLADRPPILSEGFNKLKKKLIKQEIEEFLIQRILKGMVSAKVDMDQPESVCSYISEFVSKIIRVAPSSNFNGVPSVMFFVGPTGVGKTTTLAKLAAMFSLVRRKKVAMITADTYRIAATEQLKTYGRIMGIPVEVADSAEEVREKISNYKDMDLVLVDTAGRSPSNREQLQELSKLVSGGQVDEIHLVISATTKYFDMVRIIESFGSIIPINRMIFTKLDETRFYGAFLNLMTNFQIPLSYYSTGQNVPDDLEVPEVNSLAERITRIVVS